jgi:hypothetical protein
MWRFPLQCKIKLRAIRALQYVPVLYPMGLSNSRSTALSSAAFITRLSQAQPGSGPQRPQRRHFASFQHPVRATCSFVVRAVADCRPRQATHLIADALVLAQ